MGEKIFRLIKIVLAVFLGMFCFGGILSVFTSENPQSDLTALVFFLLPEIYLIWSLREKKPYNEKANKSSYKKRSEKQSDYILNPKKFLPDEYIVIDLETTGLNPKTDFITEIGAVKVKNGKITDTFETLVKPNKPIPQNVEKLTGISNETVANAPSINITLPKFLDFIGDSILVGHNIQFDAKFIMAACQRFKLSFSNKIIDTLKLSRNELYDLENHNLETVCERLGIENTHAHRALSDVYATQQVFEKLCLTERPEVENLPGFKVGRTYGTAHYTAETKAIIKFKKLLAKIVEDDKVTVHEVLTLNDWLEENEVYCDKFPFNMVCEKLHSVFEDGKIEKSELEELLEVFNNLTEIKYDKPSDGFSLEGKRVCFSGEFKTGSFEEMENILDHMGASHTKTVSSKTDVLIVGEFKSGDWFCDDYGKQYLKAQELKYNGKNILILRESDVFAKGAKI